MKARQQLQLVQRVTDEREHRAAESLAARERCVAESEAKFAELERYHSSYASQFAQHAAKGIDGAQVREFQAFLARLGEAVRQQGEIVERAKADRDVELATWRQAAQRADMMNHVVERREGEERRAADRLEQREADEHALRSIRRHEP